MKAELKIKNRIIKSGILVMMTGIAATVAMTPEDIFSTEIGNDIMMSNILPATYPTFDTAINGTCSPVLHGTDKSLLPQ